MVSADILLSKLPPFKDQWILVKKDQEVKDIKKRITIAHKKFAADYDKVVLFFYDRDIQNVCRKIRDFIKENIEYREEPTEVQTTSLLTGILYRGYGDCKHYSLIAGGILNAIERYTGKVITWYYRFASYRASPAPHHVFVVCIVDGEEIWIDPVPGSQLTVPTWYQDKEVKISKMALYENIAGINPKDMHLTHIGAIAQLLPVAESTGATPDQTNVYLPKPFLGLEHYKEDGSALLNNWQKTADAINAEIKNGPDPGHSFTKEFVKFVFDANMKGWNFYYSKGVKPFYDPSAVLPANYPRLIMTGDGRLTFDRDVKIDDAKNPEVHALQAWAQDLINRYDTVDAQPIKPETLKGFSQGKWGGVANGNLFTQQRGASIFEQVGKGLEKAVNFVKAGVLKIVGSIPRNAFLALTGLNVFNFAGDLWGKIQAGQWENIANTWKSIGGNPTKLRNTIEDGKDKKAILGSAGNSIGDPATGSTAALLAAAAPIIAVLLKYLDKNGKATEIAMAVKSGLNTGIFPQLNVDIGDSFDFLDRSTGKPIQWTVDDADNENLGGGNNELPKPESKDLLQMVKDYPLPAAAGATIITYFIANKKGRKPNYVIPAVVGVATFALLVMGNNSTNTHELQELLALPELANDTVFKTAFKKMSASEIHTLYVAAIIYNKQGKAVPDDIKAEVIRILTKYGLEENT